MSCKPELTYHMSKTHDILFNNIISFRQMHSKQGGRKQRI